MPTPETTILFHHESQNKQRIHPRLICANVDRKDQMSILGVKIVKKTLWKVQRLIEGRRAGHLFKSQFMYRTDDIYRVT